MGTRRGGHFAVRLTVAVVVAAAAGALAAPAAQAAERNFALRFSANAQGRLAIAANTVLACRTSQPSCPSTQDGTAANGGVNNNQLDMQFVDVDNGDDAGQQVGFNSSSADLVLPPGSQVLWAGLYWGAATGGPTDAPTLNNRNRVRLRPPGPSTYTTLFATALDTIGSGTSSDSAYQAFADVTSIVAVVGGGTYTVADVQASTGQLGSSGNFGGWALVVVVENPADPARNLTVFDGYQSIQGTDQVNIQLSGFLTPPVGPVDARVALVGYEGDLSLDGDRAELDGALLSDAANPQDNVFNSSISSLGSLVTAKTPNHKNQLGFDADQIVATNVLDPSDTSTTLEISTQGDTYHLGVAGVGIDIFAPEVELAKTAMDLNGGALNLGDLVEYRIRVVNAGRDGAREFVLRDPIPAGTAYEPGTLDVPQGLGAATGPKTDAVDGDTAEHDAGAGEVRFRLGGGATGAQGGLVGAAPPAQPPPEGEVRFRVRVRDRVADGATIENVAHASYVAQTTGDAQTSESVPGGAADLEVEAPDLRVTAATAPAVVRPGGPLDLTLNVENVGHAITPAGTVTVEDTLPAGLVDVQAGGNGWDCDVSATTVSCDRSNPLGPGASYPPIAIHAEVPPAQRGTLHNEATVSAPGDGIPANDTDADDVTLAPSADVSVDLTQQSSQPIAGRDVRYVIAVANAGPSTATGVELDDQLPQALTGLSNAAVSVTGAGAAICTLPGHALDCSAAQLAPGESFEVRVDARLPLGVAPGPLANAASVSAVEPDPDPADNDDQLTAQILTPPGVSMDQGMSFPARIVGSAGPAQRTTIANDGGAPLEVADISIGGAHPLDFAVAGETCTQAPIPAGGTCTADVAFRPLAAGTREAMLVLASDAASSPDDMDLTGTGLEPPALPTVTPAPTIAAAVAGVPPHAEVRVVGRPRLRRTRARNPLLATGLAVWCPPGLPQNCGGSGRIRATVDTSLAARRRTYVVAKLGFAAPSGETRPITIRLTNRGLRILRRTRRLRVSLRLTTRGAYGVRVSTPRTVTLRLAR